MANLHPTTDTDFQNRQYGFELQNQQRPNTSNSQGIQRARVDRQAPRTDQRRMAARPQPFVPGTTAPTRRHRTRAHNRAVPMPYSQINQSGLNPINRLRGLNKKIDPMTHAAAVTRAATVSGIIFSWTALLYLCVQLPFGVFSIIMLGASVSVEGNWVYNAVLNIWNATGEIFGFPTIDIMTFFYLGWIVTSATGYICLFGAWLQYIVAFLRPTGGTEGGTEKKGLFLLAFAFYALPGFNLFPWIWLWMAAVTRYPK